MQPGSIKSKAYNKSSVVPVAGTDSLELGVGCSRKLKMKHRIAKNQGGVRVEVRLGQERESESLQCPLVPL
jgi:hypothetical protein